MSAKLVQVRAAKEREAMMDLAQAESRCRDTESTLDELNRRMAAARAARLEDPAMLALHHAAALRAEMARREAQAELDRRREESEQRRSKLIQATKHTRAAEALVEAKMAVEQEHKRRKETKERDAQALRGWLSGREV